MRLLILYLDRGKIYILGSCCEYNIANISAEDESRFGDS